MNFIEEYARAAKSSNLRDDEHHHDHEKLAAAALVSLASGSPANLLFRVKYSNDAESYPTLLREWQSMVLLKAVQREWPQHINARSVAEISLLFFLNDLCQICGGHAKLAVEGVPSVLQDDPCPACNGTGKKPLQCDGRVKKAVEDALETLHTMEFAAGAAAMKKLASDIDFL